MSQPRARRRLLAAAVASAALVAPGGAQAAFTTSQVLDASGAALVGTPSVDLARDGTGVAAWVRTDGVYVARFLGGTWQAPQRIGGGSQPAVAAGDGGRALVAWADQGTLAAAVAADADAGFGAPQPLAAAASLPSASMSINGVGYVSFTAPGPGGADVRAARLDRTGTTLAVLPDALDLDPGREAGTGGGRSTIAVSGDGTAVATWAEAGVVVARRVFGQRVSAAPQVVSVPTVQGRAAGVADSPKIHIEDDSSFAWASYRQRLDDGRFHLVASRLIGSAFDPPVIVDGTGYPAGVDVTSGSVVMNGRGEGVAVSAAQGAGGHTALLHDNKFFAPAGIGPVASVGLADAALAETNDAPTVMYAVANGPDGLLRATVYRVDPAKRMVPGAESANLLSDAVYGATDEQAGIDVAADRAGDMLALSVQGVGDGRRLVWSSFDRPPGSFELYSSSRVRGSAQPTLSWSPSFELWGPIRYEVLVDGRSLGTTTATRFQLPATIRDGAFAVQVVATDRTGQRTATRSRPIRIDTLSPTVSFALSGTRRVGSTLRVVARAADNRGGSGVERVRIDWGDGTPVAAARAASHRYTRRGRFTIRVSATDAVGNAVATTRRVTIARASRR